jgi:hypothetical protein
MRAVYFLALVSLSAASGRAMSAPLEQPTVKTMVTVEHERGGSCSELHAGKPGTPPTLNMTDVCHGWTATNCDDMVLIRGVGIVEDQAKVLFTDENREVDLVRSVDRGIIARWPGHENLHLQFRAASCDGGTLTVPFSGSHLRAKSTGSAAGFEGVLRITGPNNLKVSVER